MTEPQVWVLIGVFAAAMFGMVGIVTTSFTRTLTSAIGGVWIEINGLRETMNARFETIDVKFEAMDANFPANSRHSTGTSPRCPVTSLAPTRTDLSRQLTCSRVVMIP